MSLGGRGWREGHCPEGWEGKVRVRNNSDGGGTGLHSQFPSLRQIEASGASGTVGTASLLGPALGSTELLGGHTVVHTFPLRGSPHTQGVLRAQSFSFPLFWPYSVPRSLAPGHCVPDSSWGRPGSSGPSAEIGNPSAQAPPPLLPTGRLLRAPLRNVPFGTSQPSTPLGLRSLSPPAPGPCSSNCSWLPSRSPCQNWASVYWGQITSEREI